MVLQAGGTPVEWRIAPRHPSRSVAPASSGRVCSLGKQVTVRAHPLKGGQPGGWLIDVTKADGTVLDPDDDN